MNAKKQSRTFADFFAGIGLVRLGLEKAGWKNCVSIDNDPQKHEMYSSHFGETNGSYLIEDVRSLSAKKLPSVTLATASFPCNDLSLAGSRKGLNGKQSSAFWSFCRIVRDMGRRKPQFILLENVAGFLTSNGGNDFKEALLCLNNLGYSVDALVLDASYFVPQSRVRLFVIGKKNSSIKRKNGNIKLAAGNELRPPALTKFINSHPDIDWSIYDLPAPKKKKTILQSILDDLPNNSPEWWPEKRAAYLLSQMSKRHRTIADHMISGKTFSYGTVFRRVRNGVTRAELRTDGIAGCLRTPRGGSARQILFKAGRESYFVRLLSPRECARLMGADDYEISVPSNQALFGFGDAVCVPVIEWIARHYLNPLLQNRDQQMSNSRINLERNKKS